MKYCPRCHLTKIDDLFYSNKHNKDKLSDWCKQCNKESNAERYKKNPEKFKLRGLRFVSENREKYLESKKRYYLNNKYKWVERRKWELENCPEKYKARKRKYAHSLKGRFISNFHALNRHHKIKLLEKHTFKEWQETVKKYNNRCAICDIFFLVK